MGISKIIKFFPKTLQGIIRKKYYEVKFKKASVHEEEELTLLSKLIRIGDTVADIGANYGLYTKFLSSFTGDQGEVHSFEPIEKTFEVLKNNIKTSALKNVETYNYALSNTKGKANMEVPDYDDGGENLYEARISENTDIKGEEVRLAVFDELIDSKTKFDFIKCDVEGHEINVLKGAKNHLKDDQPVLLLEINGGINKENENAQLILSFLSELNYKPFKVANSMLKVVSEPDDYFNYFFLTPKHIEKYKALIN